jgi:hypothetical protein
MLRRTRCTADRRSSPRPDERTQHLTTDLLVTLQGDGAEVTADLLVYFFRTDEPPHRPSVCATPSRPSEPDRVPGGPC